MARSSSSSSSALPGNGAFILRVALGACMTWHGYSKVVPNHAMDHFAHYVVSLGMPYWLGYVSALVEFVGGILLLIGLLTRAAACLIAINMIVAFAKVAIHGGFDAMQLVLLLIAMALAVAFIGGGTYALDRKIGFP
ncbi:MAG TPA: DoxX family protein [Acidobacteriaceae bacterium]